MIGPKKNHDWHISRTSIRRVSLTGVLLVLFFRLYAQPIPDARVCGSLIYHHQLQKVLLLDGSIREPLHELTKIWAWDGKKWELLSESGPRARAFGGVAYDQKRNKVILHGGRSWQGDKLTREKDLWEWDGRQWQRVSEARGTEVRDHFVLLYDEGQSRTLMAGGVELNSAKDAYVWPDDCWSWDGKEWSQSKFSWPVSRISAAVFDSKHQQLIVLGGGPKQSDQNEQYNDTWIYKDQKWIKHQGINPPARNGHGLVYDPHKNVVVLYGGWSKSGERKLGDMWQWDGSSWREIKLTGDNPGKRGGHGMAYDVNRKKIVLFGGDTQQGVLNDTWEWDGIRWSRMK